MAAANGSQASGATMYELHTPSVRLEGQEHLKVSRSSTLSVPGYLLLRLLLLLPSLLIGQFHRN